MHIKTCRPIEHIMRLDLSQPRPAKDFGDSKSLFVGIESIKFFR
jgi:hypothetical protein